MISATGALLILSLMLLPDLAGFLPRVIRNHALEWSALALVLALWRLHVVTLAQPPDDPAAARLRRLFAGLDSLSAFVLDSGFVVLLGIMAAAMLASWIPHYLTWPWSRDADSYATLALSWDAGVRPYRDILFYNFPGHVYLHWLIGRTFGWGRTVPFYAVDATALLALGAVLLAWSRRALGRWLPGLLGYVVFLGFYLGRDFEQVAQRDWHTSLAAALALLTLEAWPRRAGLWAAALLTALALTIRPHAVLFLPALVAAVVQRPRPWQSLAEWISVLVLLVALGFVPVAAQGLLHDLVRNLRVASYGGPYNKATLPGALEILAAELSEPWTLLLAGSLIVLSFAGRERIRPMARTWLLALGAAILYRTVHPRQHAYLAHPLVLFSSIALALLVDSLIAASWPGRSVRALVLLVLFLEAFPGVPQFCDSRASIEAIGPLVRGEEPADPPPSVRYLWFQPVACPYEWTDYRDTLNYLRRTTSPATEIANVLKQPPFPAINGPVGRLSPFHADSGICWMWLVDLDLEIPFAEALERTPDSVVVWSPAEVNLPTRLRLERITEVILHFYRPAARFGAIEVWTRQPDVDSGRTPVAGNPGSSGTLPPVQQ